MSWLPDVPGIVSRAELTTTVDHIAAHQLPNGMVLWFPGGHVDPWNHVEAAMALALGGRVQAAEAAYRWLAETQLPDGSWYSYYLADGVEDTRRDTNVTAYIATGLWFHTLVVDDDRLLARMWPVIERAMSFVLSMQW